MIDINNCTFIGSLVHLSGGANVRVVGVKENKIKFINVDGQEKECYHEEIEYVWRP
jgi:hypothetical protein